MPKLGMLLPRRDVVGDYEQAQGQPDISLSRNPASRMPAFMPTRGSQKRHCSCTRLRAVGYDQAAVRVRRVPVSAEVAGSLQTRRDGDGASRNRTLRSPVQTRRAREMSMQGLQTPVTVAPPAARVIDLVGLLRSEYEEMPGLCLTRAQVQRLWLLEPSACDAVLGAMLDAGYLRLTSGGYVRG